MNDNQRTTIDGELLEAGREASFIVVRVRFSGWFGLRQRLDDSESRGILNDGAAGEELTLYKNIFQNRKHPALLGVAKARGAIASYLDAMSVPAVIEAGGSYVKDPGRRMIRVVDLAEFASRLNHLLDVFKTSLRTLDAAMPELMEYDRQKLGPRGLFDPTDYPTDIAGRAQVHIIYEDATVSPRLKDVCPEVYEKMVEDAKRRYDAIVENAAIEFSTELLETLQHNVAQLAPRLRLSARNKTLTIRVGGDDNGAERIASIGAYGAEVVRVLESKDDGEIPEGFVLLKVKPKVKGRTSAVWLAEPISKADYEALEPTPTTEAKTITSATISNLREKVAKYGNIAEMFGPHREMVENVIAKLRGVLGQAGDNQERLVQALRKEKMFRKTVAEQLEKITEEFQDATLANGPRHNRRLRHFGAPIPAESNVSPNVETADAPATVLESHTA